MLPALASHRRLATQSSGGVAACACTALRARPARLPCQFAPACPPWPSHAAGALAAGKAVGAVSAVASSTPGGVECPPVADGLLQLQRC